ncbi:universal stress protein [Flagellimonas sp. HMM57]|uniref:universal stress protein n=1 Tax=unclassified Flagellimonas TaxID=2644544 RepID=UPI0013D19346|nr:MULTISPECIES: universal stress protein [unclassified Flagellimonas]UII76500.1 universal stress protein [Flagellimonas sp. HMM57]
MNKILVPVDFSETSANALLYAIQLFGASSSEILVLHSYDTRSSAALLMKNIDGVLEKDAQNKMDELMQKVQHKHPDVTLKPKIIKKQTVSAIVALGNSGDFDFIVMGTKGASGLKEVFMGSVAGGVISRTSAPVIVVPDDYTYRPLDEIVFAIGNDPFSNTTVAPLKHLVKAHQSKVKVLHVADKRSTDLDVPLGHIGDLNPSIDYAFGTGDTNKDLNDYLMKDFAGLLCMVRAKKGFMERLLDESVTLKQTFNSPVPLLILHEEN